MPRRSPTSAVATISTKARLADGRVPRASCPTETSRFDRRRVGQDRGRDPQRRSGSRSVARIARASRRTPPAPHDRDAATPTREASAGRGGSAPAPNSRERARPDVKAQPTPNDYVGNAGSAHGRFGHEAIREACPNDGSSRCKSRPAANARVPIAHTERYDWSAAVVRIPTPTSRAPYHAPLVSQDPGPSLAHRCRTATISRACWQQGGDPAR
jgi:hypothetical protein